MLFFYRWGCPITTRRNHEKFHEVFGNNSSSSHRDTLVAWSSKILGWVNSSVPRNWILDNCFWIDSFLGSKTQNENHLIPPPIKKVRSLALRTYSYFLYMNQNTEILLADAWIKTIVKLLPKISEKNHVELEKSEQNILLQQIL